ncbi:MAG: GCN5-related N-acetyltransferase [Candidatus Magasanikbacteria bacterium GW2011_GWC2_37_14]|uniref:GCN5-related N-acetyltransferase n=1 Tax=Candidatus Magasanikbacteria bacterium GW2011_GWC2_37_14 TaxID=1619046 RepID=A0A0G0GM80_9BACT|nr:MAG: GCN5-related N-acetyltransferase [Candidatus Magasanikbacteria bacterium GW2011_GWC2_37_14]
MENIKLRQFEEKDKEATYNLHIEGLKQSESFIDDPKAREQLDQDLKKIREEYIDSDGEFFVAIIDDKVVGMGALRKVDDITAEIKRMRVKPELQGKGIGALILDKLIEKAKELGYKKLLLDTSIKQIVAQRLYESRGFKESRRGEIYGQETLYYQRDI